MKFFIFLVIVSFFYSCSSNPKNREGTFSNKSRISSNTPFSEIPYSTIILDQNGCKHHNPALYYNTRIFNDNGRYSGDDLRKADPKELRIYKLNWSGKCINGFADGKGQSDIFAKRSNNIKNRYYFTGSKKRGLRHGNGQLRNKGNILKGGWDNGREYGTFSYRIQNGSKFTTKWNNGTKVVYKKRKPYTFNDSLRELAGAAVIVGGAYVAGTNSAVKHIQKSKQKKYDQCYDNYTKEMYSKLGKNCGNVMKPEYMKLYGKHPTITKVVDDKCDEIKKPQFLKIKKQCENEVY